MTAYCLSTTTSGCVTNGRGRPGDCCLRTISILTLQRRSRCMGSLFTRVRGRGIPRSSSNTNSWKSTCRMLHIPATTTQGQALLTFALNGDTTRGSPIPLQAGIKAHPLCEENVHLRHIRRLFEALQSVRISLLRRACLFPLQGSPAFLLPAPRSCAVVFLMYGRLMVLTYIRNTIFIGTDYPVGDPVPSGPGLS
jgi:hypothetical protein